MTRCPHFSMPERWLTPAARPFCLVPHQLMKVRRATSKGGYGDTASNPHPLQTHKHLQHHGQRLPQGDAADDCWHWALHHVHQKGLQQRCRRGEMILEHRRTCGPSGIGGIQHAAPQPSWQRPGCLPCTRPPAARPRPWAASAAAHRPAPCDVRGRPDIRSFAEDSQTLGAEQVSKAADATAEIMLPHTKVQTGTSGHVCRGIQGRLAKRALTCAWRCRSAGTPQRAGLGPI